MKIDLEHTICFLEVARLLSFSKAADVLYLSQPAVSRKVAFLEDQMGVTLIQRGNRELKLTEAGEEFKIFFQELNSRFFALQQKHSNIVKGRISFGIFNGCNIMDFTGNFIANFQQQNSGTEFFCSSGDSTSLISGLHTRQLDFIIGLKDTFINDDDLVLEDVCESRRAIIFSKKNPLAQKTDLCLQDFADQHYYTFLDGKIVIDSMTNIDGFFKKYGFKPVTRLLNSIEAIFIALHAGVGYTIVNEHQRILTNTEFGHLMFPDSLTLSLAYSKQLDKASIKYKFIQQLLEELHKHL